MNASNSAHSTNRCQYRTPSGRQCSSPTEAPGAAFCARHAIAPPNDSIDFTGDLIREEEHFQQAQQINHSLIALYRLLAAGRISPRRASVLAYVAHLILNTHKAIDYDNLRYHVRTSHPALRPAPTPIAESVGPGTEPLPDTAEEFVAAVLKRKPS